jgi:hypothetical protein
MWKAQFLQLFDFVPVAVANRRGGPFANAVDRKNRCLLKR